MSLFNLGRTDEFGNQRRIEHRGRNLRASRTGGVALRAQARAAGVNVTANTSTGFRVSATPLQNTQMALQNGRFVLKGRYGRGPTKLNLSKSGVSVSTRNALGSFNWFKPKRSSAKFAGIQVRGEKAAWIQAVYLFLMAGAAVVQVLAQLLALLGQGLLALLGILYRLVLATPYAVRTLRRRLRNRRVERRLSEVAGHFTAPPVDWSREELLAGLLLVFGGWGRGRKAVSAAEKMAPRLEGTNQALLREARPALPRVAQRLEVARNEAGDEAEFVPHACLALIARRMERELPPDAIAEAMLQVDDVALNEDARTRLQEELLEVFADFAAIRFQEPEGGTEEPAFESREDTTTAPMDGTVNLNTATRRELETLPHIGPERAEQLIALRPLREIEDLTRINGIGPGRLEAIRQQGAMVPDTGEQRDDDTDRHLDREA
jgi:DNA uptake protein ComE-like DNA-binding protein